ncbi:MAG: PAS domain-containing protein [Planctomycetota bacterium]|nr:PAS domain-containing protein [Planctomycetota bacterium]
MTNPSISNSDAPRPESSQATAEANRSPEEQSTGGSPKFSIVGIGASAGGLEAISQFLTALPVKSNLAVVVVQHLDPTQVGLLPELLQRCTTVPVCAVIDQTHVKPNSVYVIPPDRDLSILNGVLHLLEPIATRGLRLPIDFFFQALADDQQERSVGVVLSGMGADGTVGLKAIKKHGGLTLAQEPKSAKFDSMPMNAINVAHADMIATPAEMPQRILQHLNRVPVFSFDFGITETESNGQFEKIILLLRSHTGHDFSKYKRNTLYRRIERRMGIHKLLDLPLYVRYLRENPGEIDLLFKELLIGVTSFFRDPEIWNHLRELALNGLIESRTTGQAIRAWVPGCSTGEEAYSLAILIRETLEASKLTKQPLIQIFATDLDSDAIDRARQGFFPEISLSGISEERLLKYFTEEPIGFRIKKEIREMVVFATQNIAMDPPFTKLDILSCRNLMIYLGVELQTKLLPLFHYSLNPGGTLLLGSAESIGTFTDLFETLNSKARIFRRLEAPSRSRVMDFTSTYPPAVVSSSVPADPIKPSDNFQTQAEQWLLKHFAPAAVIVTDQGDILYISGRTGRFLEPAAGKANWNIFVMARESLRYELASAFQKARGQKGPVIVRCLYQSSETESSLVELSVQVIDGPGSLSGLVVAVFNELTSAIATTKDTSAAVPSNDNLSDLESQLQQAKADVQRAREDMQTSREELTSMNEELQSTNEELQSTNEELTTSKEEMQSLNEELQTVNAELQTKLDELSATSNDMKNLLNSTQIATVFLDNSLKVRRFTEHVTQIIKLIPTDVGRPVTDLAISLLYPELAADALEVLRTLIPIDKSLVSTDGRWFATRLMPYRTLDNRISGVVITFTDMTVVKILEAELYQQKNKIN